MIKWHSDFDQENNHDFVETNFLYNTAFTRESRALMRLDRMNSTVYLTNLSIQDGYFMATRDLDYAIGARSSGIADLAYRQSGPRFIPGPSGSYEIANANSERYYGTYNIARQIRMTSTFDDVDKTDEWMPCCSDGWLNMNSTYQSDYSTEIERFFDCNQNQSLEDAGSPAQGNSTLLRY